MQSDHNDNRGVAWALFELGAQIILVILAVHYLHPFLATDAAPAQVAQDNVRFRAVDCEHAKVTDAYAAHQQVDCENDTTNVKANLIGYTLVEKFVADSAPGFRCVLAYSRTAYECGMFSHLALGGLPTYHVPQQVSVTDCRKWSETKEATFFGRRYPIEIDGVNIISVATTGDLEYSNSEYTCQGVTEKVGEKTIRKAFVTTQIDLTITPVNFKIRDHRVYSPPDHVVTRCHAMTSGCEEGDRTYVWSIDHLVPDESCQIQVVKAYVGRLIYNNNDPPAFVDETNKFYITLHETTRVCDVNAYVTAYDRLLLVLTSDLEQHQLGQSKSSAPRLTAWVSSRDDYLAYYAEVLTQQRLDRDHRSRCLTRRSSQHREPGLHHQDGLNYVLNAGEITYHIACTRTSVTPRATEACYEDMPVSAKQGPRYMEPTTRLLKRHSPVAPCFSHLPASFQAEDQHWYSMSPHLTLAAPPSSHRPEVDSSAAHLHHNDLSNRGGIISTQDMERRLEEQEWTNYHSATVAALVSTSCRHDDAYTTSCPTVTYSLAKLATPEQFQAYVRSQWTRFRHFAASVGEISAFILLVLIAIYVFIFIIRTVWRACHLFPRHGINRRSMLAAVSMSTRLYQAWYAGEEPLPTRASLQVPSAKERQKTRAISDSLQKHLAGKEAKKQKRNSSAYGGGITDNDNDHSGSSTSTGIFTENSG